MPRELTIDGKKFRMRKCFMHQGKARAVARVMRRMRQRPRYVRIVKGSMGDYCIYTRFRR